MPPLVNPIRYPTLYAYLCLLPDGVRSYPELRCTTQMHIAIRTQYPELMTRDDLPEDVQRAVRTEWPTGGRMPEVAFMIANALARDIVFRDDEKYRKFCYHTTWEMYQGLMMRSVLYFVSPKVMLLGATKYWQMFKEGSRLTSIGGGRSDHVLDLQHPERAYLKCMLEGFGQSLLAAADAAGAKGASVTVAYPEPVRTRFSLRWAD